MFKDGYFGSIAKSIVGVLLSIVKKKKRRTEISLQNIKISHLACFPFYLGILFFITDVPKIFKYQLV